MSARHLLRVAATGGLACVSLAVVAARGTAEGSTAASAVGPTAPTWSLHRTIPTTELTQRRSRKLQASSWAGGIQQTASGARVRVYVSSTYADADAVAARWAGFIAALPHGRELELLEAYVAPLADVARICGSEALGCYGWQQLVSIGEAVDGITAEEVVRHEYGHHVAANRLNSPWTAVDWGPKRWASAANVCARTSGLSAFPGDQGARYALNPGEAFAEAYRVSAELGEGASTFSWQLVDPSFSPTPEALAAVSADVLRPWAERPARAVQGRFAGRARTWTLPLETRLDGDLWATVQSRGRHSLQLVDGSGRVVGTYATRSNVHFTICGQRKLELRVRRSSGSAAFTLRIKAP